jgi:hypothetical protein
MRGAFVIKPMRPLREAVNLKKIIITRRYDR